MNGNLNLSRETVLTVYGDFLDKISISKVNRESRMKNEENDWPAPVSLKDLSLRGLDLGSLDGSLRGSGVVINSSEQNIIDIIINDVHEDKEKVARLDNSTKPVGFSPKRIAPPVPNRRPTTLQTIKMNNSGSNIKNSRRSTSPSLIQNYNQNSENNIPAVAKTPSDQSNTQNNLHNQNPPKLNHSRSAINSSFLIQTSEYFNRQLTSCIQTLQNLLPLFVQRCTDHIEIHGKNFEGLYRIPANARERKELVQQFDQNPYLDLTKFSINTICGAVTWFHSEKNLKHPVVSPNLAKQLANTVRFYLFMPLFEPNF